MGRFFDFTPQWQAEVKGLAAKACGGDRTAIGTLADLVRKDEGAASFVANSDVTAMIRAERSGAYMVQIAAMSHKSVARQVLRMPKYLGLVNGLGLTTQRLIDDKWGLKPKPASARGFHILPTEETWTTLGEEAREDAADGKPTVWASIIWPKQ